MISIQCRTECSKCGGTVEPLDSVRRPCWPWRRWYCVSRRLKTVREPVAALIRSTLESSRSGRGRRASEHSCQSHARWRGVRRLPRRVASAFVSWAAGRRAMRGRRRGRDLGLDRSPGAPSLAASRRLLHAGCCFKTRHGNVPAACCCCFVVGRRF